ncbi:MAG: glycosyltransferase family 4 protein [Thermoanaerobaculia bacterium]
MRRVVLVNRFFHPDHSATSQMASDLAFHLAGTGWEVIAITGRLLYEDASRIDEAKNVRGVRIVRIWTTRFGRHNLLGRAIDYATFYASAFFAILANTNPGDMVIAMTDPPLISVVAAAAARIRRARLINWVQDLFPDVAIALGMRIPKVLRSLRDWSLRQAGANVAISERMSLRMPRAIVRENWAPGVLRPVDRATNSLRREWGLDDGFVVGYSGNLGRAHDAATIAGAIGMVRDAETQFLFVGAGAGMQVMRETADRRVTFKPYQPVERLAESLSSADVHIVSVDRRLEGLILPSKFYGVLAVARPVIFIGDPDGEVAGIIDSHGCGMVVSSGDAAGLAAAIDELARDGDRCREMGERGRALYESRYDRSHALEAWNRLLERLS